MAYYGFARRIKEAMILGIRECGEAIFHTSQTLVPVDTGHLRKSGRLKKIPNGIEINYRAPYAAPVEFGFPRHSERVKRHFVKSHLRKYRHYRSIRNVRTGKLVTHRLVQSSQSGMMKMVPIDIRRKMKKPILVRDHYRGPFTRQQVSGRVGKYYLTNSVNNHLPDVHNFIARHL